MTAETIKVECLKLVAEKMNQPDAAKMVEAADALYRWVTSDASPERPEGTERK